MQQEALTELVWAAAEWAPNPRTCSEVAPNPCALPTSHCTCTGANSMCKQQCTRYVMITFIPCQQGFFPDGIKITRLRSVLVVLRLLSKPRTGSFLEWNGVYGPLCVAGPPRKCLQ